MINYEVNMDDLREIENMLGIYRDKSKIVLKNAINDTAKQTQKLLIQKTAEKYAIRDKNAIKKTMTLSTAKASKLVAVLTSKGRVNELYNFKVAPNIYVRGGGVPGGYKGKVIKSSRGKKLILKPQTADDQYKAFIVKYKSGHMTVGQRVPGKKMKSNPHKEFVKSLLSPSLPKMLGGEQGVFNDISPQVYEMLQDNIQKNLLKYLG